MIQLREKWINDFTSLGAPTGPNGIRPETRTSIAIGKINAIESAGRNNLKIIIKVPSAKYDFSGYISEDSPVTELINQAKEKDIPVALRFEKKRKKDVDPTTPIAELTKDSSIARDSIVNIVAGIYNFNNSSWLLSDDAVSNPKEDPDHVKAEIEGASYNTENFFGDETPKLHTTEKDWKSNHLITMFNFASEHSKENEIGLETKSLKLLASYMLTACDQLQMNSLGLKIPVYSDYSHTKARGMLFSWMGLNPLSIEIMSTKGEFSNWINRFATESQELWAWAKGEAEK